MEMRKASYLADYAIKSAHDSGAQIHADVLTDIVKTANACIPAMSTLLPMDKFAVLCDTVLEAAAYEVGQGIAKRSALKKRAEEMFVANSEAGEITNPEGDMDYVMELLKEIGLDAGTAGLFAGAEYDEQPEEAVVDKFNQQIAGNNPVELNNEVAYNNPNVGYVGPDQLYAPGADFNATDPLSGAGAWGRVAELTYIDTMNEIKKAAQLVQKSFKKTAGEAGNSPEVAKQVTDEGTASAAKPAEEKAAAAAKKPEINSTTVGAANITPKAVASDVTNIMTPDSKVAPTPSQGNVELNTKMSSLDFDTLVNQCNAIFKKR
jgi:hypothetical protein